MIGKEWAEQLATTGVVLAPPPRPRAYAKKEPSELAALRIASGLSQSALAKRIGVSRSPVAEGGRCPKRWFERYTTAIGAFQCRAQGIARRPIRCREGRSGHSQGRGTEG